jgi:putative ATP-dependent endonuclease of OLD family
MKITKVKIENYKSIKNIEFDVSPKVNVFIGENSSGKSNIFNAITWLVGPTYPSFNSITKEDYFRGEENRKIKIDLTFDDDSTLEMAQEWQDGYGREKSGLNLNNNYITDIQREKYISSFIGVDREINDYLPSNKWSLIGRFLQDINNRFKSELEIDPETEEEINKSEAFKQKLVALRDDYLFSVTDEDGNNIMNEFVKILQQETARQLNREESEFNVDLNLYDPWNFYKTLQLTVHETDMGIDFRASELGMGVQASITIAILKAYSKLKLNNNTPIFIDEPELFLHPHGRRNFYKIIRDLADNGTQVFLTTHSTEFIDLGYFDEILVVRKNSNDGTYIRKANPNKFAIDFTSRTHIPTTEEEIKLRYKNAYENTGDSLRASEAMFARKIILVEGESENLILPYFFNILGFNYIAEGISIVRCGGKSELDRFYRLYMEFGIPCFIIFDGDYQNVGTDGEENSKKENRSILEVLGGDIVDFPETSIASNYLCFKTEIEDNLNIDSPNCKGLKLYKKVKEQIVAPESIPKWATNTIEKIKQLPEVSTSCLKNV